MTKLFLIRHSQAEGNVYRFMQGHFDGKVTSFGEQQIDALAERLKDEKIDLVYSSDLSRSISTAEAVLRYRPQLTLQIDPRLREINMGAWEAVPMGNIAYNDIESVKLFLKDSPDWRTDGAETFAEVEERVHAAISEICEKNRNKSIAVVSHGVSIRCFQAAVMGVPLHEATNLPLSRNTAVSCYEYNNGHFSPQYINDASHLESLCAGAKYEPFSKSTTFLRYESGNPRQFKKYYMDCYEKAWKFAHGHLFGYNGETYYHSAQRHYSNDKEAVMRIFDKDYLAGLLDLDPKRGAEENYGWISLLYLEEKYRGRGLAAQILGMAIIFFRKRGRTHIRLTCAETNLKALKFYRNYGFYEKSRSDTDDGSLILLEKEI